MAKKDNSGYVLPIIVDPPRKCIKIWIPDEVYHRGAFWGAIFELTQAFNWQQNDPSKARLVANLWFDIWSQATEDNQLNGCCGDVAVQYRVNPATGLIEQSSNGGGSWQPAANTLQQYIVEPAPPIPSGIAATKCDAATNVSGQVNAWIEQVTNDFDTSVALLDFALAVLEAILVAVVTILSAGTLTAAELLVLPTIAAACTAAFTAGKSAFVAYWTTENKDKVLCAAFCNIGDDGHFTDAQFSGFWNQCNSDLPPSPAKMLFMGFLSSVGRQGLNAMAATGLSADADCSDCTACLECSERWSVFGGAHGVILSQTTEFVEVQASDGGNGNFYVILKTPNVDTCCSVDHLEFVSGGASLHGWTDCGQPQVEGVPQHTGIGFGACINYTQLQDVSPFTVKIFFVDCP